MGLRQDANRPVRLHPRHQLGAPAAGTSCPLIATPRVGYPDDRRRFATSAPASAVQPVWWEAPSPSPVSPWKYS